MSKTNIFLLGALAGALAISLIASGLIEQTKVFDVFYCIPVLP